MEETCSMIGCSNTINNSPRVQFYPFPKDFDMCMLWVQNCGRAEFFEDFAYGGAQPFINRVLCSDHFDSADFNDTNCLTNGLKPRATPVLTYEEPTLVLVKEEVEDADDSEFEEDTRDVKHEPPGAEISKNINETVMKILQVDFEQNKLAENEPLVISKQNANKSPSEKSQNAFRMAWRRALETAEQRDARNRANALRNAFRRAHETEEQRKARNQANAVRNASRRANESDDQRKDRLYKNAVRAALRRSMESEDEQKDRRRKNALRAAVRRSVESEEQRAVRRFKDKIRSAERRKKETETQSKLRKYNDAVRAAFRRSNENEEQKQRRRMYDVMRAARRRSNETDEQRQKRLQADRKRAARRRLLKKLHSTGTNFDCSVLDSSGSEDVQGSYPDYDFEEESTNDLDDTSSSDSTNCDLANKSEDSFSDNNNCNQKRIGHVYNSNTDLHNSDEIKLGTIITESVNASTPEFVWCM